MSTETTETMRTSPAAAPPAAAGEESDPLAKITLTPRRFVAVLAVVGLLLGLLLALLPVGVASPHAANPGTVTCGNTVGGVETDLIAADLGSVDQPTIVSYVDMCERAVSERTDIAWPLFFAGGLVIVWMGVVRRPSRQ